MNSVPEIPAELDDLPLPPVCTLCVPVSIAEARQLPPLPLTLRLADAAGETPDTVLLDEHHRAFSLMRLAHFGKELPGVQFEQEVERLLAWLRVEYQAILSNQERGDVDLEASFAGQFRRGQYTHVGSLLRTQQLAVRHVRQALGATLVPDAPPATWAWMNTHLPAILGHGLTPAEVREWRLTETTWVSAHGAVRLHVEPTRAAVWLASGERRTLHEALLTLASVRVAMIPPDDELLDDLQPAEPQTGVFSDWGFIPPEWTQLENDHLRLAFDQPDAPALLRERASEWNPHPDLVRMPAPEGGWLAR